MKIKHRNKNKVLLKPLNVGRRRKSILNSFRTYRNYTQFGVKDKRARKKRLAMKGRGPTESKTIKPAEQKSFVTDNDSEWIKKLNPYDKLIANKSLKTLGSFGKLIKQFDPDYDGNLNSFITGVGKLQALKSKVVQGVLGYGEGADSSSKARLAAGRLFRDLGLTLSGMSWLFNTGHVNLETVAEYKQQITAALDDLLSQARVKGQEALGQLNQLYLKQGDREENEQIRNKEEKKQDEKNEELRKKDREESLPDLQSIEEVNPLGYVSGHRYLKVDPKNEAQVKSIRNNNFLREQDKSYFDRNSKVKNISFDAHKKPPVVDKVAQQQKVAQQTQQKQQVPQTFKQSKW